MGPALSLAARVELWDVVLAAVRTELRCSGLREVTTPPMVAAVAIEPWIEPVCAGAGWLHTSPELAMKSLLVGGAGPIFQLTHVARAAERGAWHREQFVLLEWYRPDRDDAVADADGVMADVARLVAVVVQAAAPWALRSIESPHTWSRIAFLDAVEDTTGLQLQGDEDGDALARRMAATPYALPPLRTASTDARRLEAWTAFFSGWSDAALDPWLRGRAGAGAAVHLVDFPAPLAALSKAAVDSRGRTTSGRFESHVFGRELANGYRELRDATEQRARFVAVAELRAAHALPVLPMPEAFLADLAAPGLPPCSGAALGLDRLVALAVGADALAGIALVP